jgi:hypothetical protein
VYLTEGFEATCSAESASVCLTGARIGGNLNCRRTILRNDSGPALYAPRLQVEQDVYLTDGFEATCSAESASVCLTGARIGGNLDCRGAILRNNSGPAFNADSARVELDVSLCDGFVATGTSKFGAVRLPSAYIGGQLNCARAVLRNDCGSALNVDSIQVKQHVFLSDGFEASGAGEKAVLVLEDVRIGGCLKFDPARLIHRTNPQELLNVDGLIYSGVPRGIDTDTWLTLLREATPVYAPQPYQELAAAHRAAGHESQARRILIAQRRDQINRGALTGRAERAWARLTGVTLGYGYQPWRALIGLFAILGVAVLLALVLGGHGGLAQVQSQPLPTSVQCGAIDRIGVGLDLGTPLLTTGARTRCEPTRTTTGGILTITGWILRLLAWALATLFIAGFTSAVRKT